MGTAIWHQEDASAHGHHLFAIKPRLRSRHEASGRQSRLSRSRVTASYPLARPVLRVCTNHNLVFAPLLNQASTNYHLR
jgi:hypothetical protein